MQSLRLMINKTKSWLSISVLVVGLLSLVSVTNAAETQQTTSDFESAECFFDLNNAFITPETLGFECGYVTVPEQHANPDGPTIRLPVAIRKATSSSPKPDPVFLAQGGPGGDAFAVFSITAAGTGIAADRDIVLFNQRGTQFAEPRLDCVEFRNIQEQLFTLTDEDEIQRLSDEALLQCRNRLVNEENINLSAYDSLENAQDIDLIRQALGYDQYNFYGVSYGTLLGLHLIRLDQPALRSVILDSVVPTQTNFITHVAQSENGAYDEYFAACQDDADCSALYADLEPRLLAIYDKLDETPATLTLTNDDTGESFESVLTGESLRGLMFSMFYLPDFYAAFPKFVLDAEEGNFEAFEFLASQIAFDDTMSIGMYYSVICAEYGEFSGNDALTDGVRPFISEDAAKDVDAMQANCADWQVESLPTNISEPVQSDIPTLLISGRFDPITPAAFAADAATTLGNSYNVVNPLGSHGNIWGGNACSEQIASDFLNNPAQAPDTSCYANEEQLEVLDPDVIPVPLLNGIAALETATVVQLGSLITLAFLLLSGIVLWPLAWFIRQIRNSEKIVERRAARIASRVLVSLTGLVTLTMIGFLFAAIAGAFSNTGLLYYGGLPGTSRYIFMVAPVVLVLALLSFVLLVRAWRDASIWGKIFQIFLMVCLTGISVLLFTLQMFAPIFA